MPFDITSHLWSREEDAFFRTSEFRAIKQQGPHCVATVLAMLTGEAPECFQGKVNTQDPVSWSGALHGWGMKLAYCPTDARKLKHYMKELVRLDDLFTLSYYAASDPQVILGDPDEQGWVTGSHIVLLHRDLVLDPALGVARNAFEHPCYECHTKRIFRVVPKDHARGL